MDAIIGALKSKTMWVGVLTIILGTVVPVVNTWIAAHPGPAASVLGVVMMILRTFTTQSLSEKGNPPGQPPSA